MCSQSVHTSWQRKVGLSWQRVLLLLLSGAPASPRNTSSGAEDVLSRHKRFLYYTSDRRFALPPQSALSVSVTVSMPFQRGMPTGYDSGTNLELPFNMDLDKLHWTSEENPFLRLPFGDSKRKKRQLEVVGDRILLYRMLEDFLSNLGMDGQACLLRTICETHEMPLFSHGFFGEALRLLLTASLAYDPPETLDVYLEAERMGADYANCRGYEARCPHSLYSRARPHPKKKDGRTGRFLYFTSDRRIALPFGSVGNAYISLGFNNFRGVQRGTSLSMSISASLGMLFDELGWTSEQNPFNDLSPLGLTRRRRGLGPEEASTRLTGGGDREQMYEALEHYLETFDLDGKACLLRAICEMQEKPMRHYSFVGEIFAIFLTPTRAPRAEERLPEYVRAERAGRRGGDCRPYASICHTSAFVDGPGAGSEAEKLVKDFLNITSDDFM